MKRYILISMFILFLLGGCAEKPLVPTLSQEVSFYESGEKPRELMTGNTKVGLLTVLIDYCWSEDVSICETKIENPAKNLEGKKTQLMEKGELVSFQFDANPVLKAPLPTSTKLYQFKDDKITEISVIRPTSSISRTKVDAITMATLQHLMVILKEKHIMGLRLL